MTSDQHTPPIRLREPGDVVQFIPYLVGFTPQDSLVAMVTRDNRVEVTARADLADVDHPGTVEDLLDRLQYRFPDSDLHLLAYTQDREAGWDILDRCVEHLPHLAVGLAMVVDDTSWYLSNGTSGTLDPYGVAAAEATLNGLAHLNSRADLEARFASAPATDDLLNQADTVIDELPPAEDVDRIAERTLDLIQANLPTTQVTSNAAPTLSTRDGLELALLVQHQAARDTALLAITDQDAEAHHHLWRNVVNTVPAYGAASPLYLAGMAAWISGDGASASIALDRALASNPRPDQRRDAQVLARIIDQVIHPSAWTDLREDALTRIDDRVRTVLARAEQPIEPELWETVTPPSRPQRQPEPPSSPPPTPGIAV